MFASSAVTRSTFTDLAGSLLTARNFGQRMNGLRCAVKKRLLDPLNKKIFRSGRAVQVRCRIAGGATTRFSCRKVHGTTTATSLLRARGTTTATSLQRARTTSEKL